VNELKEEIYEPTFERTFTRTLSTYTRYGLAAQFFVEVRNDERQNLKKSNCRLENIESLYNLA
jgi:hypothetical protein